MNLLALRLSALLLALAPALGQAQRITVSAASSLTEALREVGTRFEAQRPGVAVQFNFGASGALVQQIVQGAPVDVFVSADPESMDRAAAGGHIEAGTRSDFTRNTLVLVAPLDAKPPLQSLADLAAPGVRRIAIGRPATVPAGRYARQALEAAGLWSRVEARIVPVDNVRQALDYTARGEVDAGFVYRTDAALQPGRLRVVAEVGGLPPIRYPAAVVASGRQPAIGRAFVAYLLSDEAQAILARHGFARP